MLRFILALLFVTVYAAVLPAQSSQAQEIYRTALNMYDLHMADVDHDGDLDIVGASNESEQGFNTPVFAWLENVGGIAGYAAMRFVDTPFEPYTNYDFGWDVMGYVELNGDGKVDVLIRNFTENEVIAIPSAVGGGYASPVATSISLVLHTNLRLVDFNADGLTDLYYYRAANGFDGLYVRLADGNGGFLPQQQLLAADDYGLMVWHDVDSDGDPDLLAVAEDAFELYENSNGSLQLLSTTIIPAGLTTIRPRLVTDSTGVELQFSGKQGNVFYYYRSQLDTGNSTFLTPQIADVPYGFGSENLAHADLDADGDLDWILNTKAEQLSVVLNNGFGNPEDAPMEIGLPLFFADEVVLLDRTGSLVKGLLRGGNGDLIFVSRLHIDTEEMHRERIDSRHRLRHLVGTDVNQDGRTDLIGQGGHLADELLILYGLPNGHFSVPQGIDTLEGSSVRIRLNDFDGDGDEDVLVHTTNENTLELYQQLSNDTWVATGYFAGYELYNVNWTDYDADGDADLIAAQSGVGTVVFDNEAGGFSASKVLLPDVELYDYADIDGDGAPDAIFTPYNGDLDSLGWAKITVDTTIIQGGLVNLVERPSNFDYDRRVVDLTGNGRADFVIPGYPSIYQLQSDSISVYQEPEDFIYGPGEDYFSLTDLDLDGVTDLLTDQGNTDQLMYHRNLGGGQLADPVVVFEHDANPEFFNRADIDHDGVDDFLAWDNLLLASKNTITQPVGYLAGYHYWDENDNQTFDVGEVTFGNRVVRLPELTKTFRSSPSGKYTIGLPEGNYTLRGESFDFWQVQADSILLADVATADTVEHNIAYQPMATEPGAQLELTTGILRCDTEMPVWLTITNTGNTRLDLHCQLIIDTLLTVTNTSIDTVNQSSDTVWVDLAPLIPGQLGKVRVDVLVPDFQFIDSTLIIRAKLIDPAMDSLVYDFLRFTDRVRCAYDPNDKQVQPAFADYPNYALLDAPLDYTVRFQNTGNDTAFQVRIEDPISPYLDINTLRITGSSHSVAYDRVGDRAIFLFEDIALPDSSTNFVGSQGFVRFRIRPHGNIPASTAVQNSAGIYFDSNPPILTNTVENILVETYPVIAEYDATTCGGPPNGAIHIVFPPATFDFKWADGAVGPIREDLLAGSYSVVIKDGDGRTVASEQLIVPSDTDLQVAITATAATHSTSLDGSLEAVATGGTSPYAYNWGTEPTQTTAIATGLAPGTYTVTVTDAMECSYVQTATVDQLTSVDEIPESRLRVHPNPTTGQFRITGVSPGAVQQCFVVDGLGRQLPLTNFGVDYQLPITFPGLYRIVVTLRDGSVRQAVLIVIP